MGPKEWSIGVFGIIKEGVVTDENRRILVSRRADGQGWDLPGGGVDGKSDNGTNFVETLRREIWEETGLWVEGKPILIGIYPDFAKKDVMILYLVAHVTGDATPSKESLEHRFVDFETIKKEIRLVEQEYPGHERGRFWEMVRDGFSSLTSPFSRF